jgi:TctA family transporter
LIAELLQLKILVPWLLGMVFGIFVGATPGLTATMAVALIVPISFRLEPTAGLAMIIGVSFTAIFAGDIPATFLRIPGTPASAAATLDGYQLGRQGKGSLAHC